MTILRKNRSYSMLRGLVLCFSVWLVVSTFAGGCMPPIGPRDSRTQVDFQAEVRDLKATPQNVPIEIYSDAKGPALPPVFSWNKSELGMAQDFPTKDDPHVVVGVLTVHQPIRRIRNPKPGTQAKLKAAMDLSRDEAAIGEARVHGANALVLRDVRTKTWHRDTTYLALRLSKTEPVYATADELLQGLSAAKNGRMVQRKRLMLEDLGDAQLNVPMKRGHCYTLALALGPTATRPQGKDIGILATMDRDGETLIRRRLDQKMVAGNRKVSTLDGAVSRVVARSLLCPAGRGATAKVNFKHALSHYGDHPLLAGDGPIEVAIFEEDIDPKDAEEIYCNRCRKVAKVMCDSTRLNSCKHLKGCLAKQGMTVDACRPNFR